VVLIETLPALADALLTLAPRFPSVEFRANVPITADVAVVAGEDFPAAGPLDSFRWLHVLSAGYNHLLGRTPPVPGLLVTNSSGAYTDGIAEFVLMRLLMHARRAEEIYQAQLDREWGRWRLGGATLRGKILTVIGSGSIGREVARFGRALGMQVRLAGRADAPRLPELVADADYIVTAASLNPSSRGIVSRELLAAMKARPFLVNISRGALIDTAALLDALRAGTLSGAALDVFDEEPLPPASTLWSTPGLSVSPHVSGVFAEVNANLIEVFAANLEAFLAGRPLPNLISLGG